MQAQKNSQYVYIYQNAAGKIVYVGRGKSATRAISHEMRTHNSNLADEIKAKTCTISIAGPYDNQETASAVETALIACLPDAYNRALGPTKWRFRPFGIPLSLAARLDKPRITPAQKKKIEKEGVIYTYINSDMDALDGRNYSPAGEQDDPTILVRFDRWWSVRTNAERWSRDPETSPRWLIGVSGPKRRRLVIGCVEINKKKWGKSLEDSVEMGGSRRRLQIPVKRIQKLDAHPMKLRGLIFSEDSAPIFTQQGHLVVPRS